MNPTTTSSTPQTCPDVGTWRAWLDHEDHADWLPAHLAGCPGCRSLVAELRDDAHGVGDLFASLAPARLPEAAEIAVARERLEWRRAQPIRPTPLHTRTEPGREPIPMLFTRFTTPWRIAASGIAAALLLTLLIAFTPQGSALAAGFLAQFRSQNVAAINVTPQTQGEIMKSLAALNNLGTVHLPNAAAGGTASPAQVARSVEQKSHTAPTIQDAANTLHLSIATPDLSKLPSGVDRTPTIDMTPSSEISFTFDKNKARAYYQSTGHPDVSLPDKFDGATLSVSIPGAAVLHYSGATNSKNELIVVEAGELLVGVQGNVTIDEMRDFLLSLPGLPPNVVDQLKNIKDWKNTLPIPVPVDQVNAQSKTINGAQGLLLDDNSGLLSAAIWHANGQLYGVAGTYTGQQVLDIANSMAVR